MPALTAIARKLAREVSALRFGAPVTHVYNPLDYAWAPHRAYLERFGTGRPGRTLLVGMNPGPFGMAQTGVPFGEVALVRDWLGIDGRVGKPANEHPSRPIEGFACRRSEVSGQRLWGWAKQRFGRPERFFERFFVWNYCPLVFMEQSGRNRTPDKLAGPERAALYAVCDRALHAVARQIAASGVVGIGAFAMARARAALVSLDLPIGGMLHPSPASPLANRGWAERAEQDLTRLHIALD